MFKLFTRHPHSVNETYFQHLFFTLKTGSKVVIAGLVCVIHGIFPFIFTDVASKSIISLSDKVEGD